MSPGQTYWTAMTMWVNMIPSGQDIITGCSVDVILIPQRGAGLEIDFLNAKGKQVTYDYLEPENSDRSRSNQVFPTDINPQSIDKRYHPYSKLYQFDIPSEIMQQCKADEMARLQRIRVQNGNAEQFRCKFQMRFKWSQNRQGERQVEVKLQAKVNRIPTSLESLRPGLPIMAGSSLPPARSSWQWPRWQWPQRQRPRWGFGRSRQ